MKTKNWQQPFGWVFGFQLDLLEKNLITLTRVTFTENDLMQGVSLNHIYLKKNLLVEQQKLNQTAPFGLVFGVQLGLRQMPVTKKVVYHLVSYLNLPR